MEGVGPLLFRRACATQGLDFKVRMDWRDCVGKVQEEGTEPRSCSRCPWPSKSPGELWAPLRRLLIEKRRMFFGRLKPRHQDAFGLLAWFCLSLWPGCVEARPLCLSDLVLGCGTDTAALVLALFCWHEPIPSR